MYVSRIFLGSMLAIGLGAMALTVSALGVFGPHGHGPWFGAPVFVSSGYHGDGHWHRQGHRRGPGKGYRTLYSLEHRHGGLGWQVHREWRRQRTPAPPRHGSRRNDDWEDGAGIALGLLAGMHFLNQFADGASAAGTPGHAGAYSRVLDVHSQQRQGRAIRDVLEAGGSSSATWVNPANRGGSASGEVRVTRNGRDDFGNPCREYHQTVRVGNRTEQGYRVACRGRNGNWHLQP